jgi:glutamate-ammonia-ligase adenylyltransferase
MSFDKQITTSDQLQTIGILDTSQAFRNLELLRAELGPDGFPSLLQPVLNDLSQSADPDMALNNFERFVSALKDVPRFISLCRARHDVLRSLITAFGASRFLSTVLVTSADDSLNVFETPDYLTHSAGRATLIKRLSSMIDKDRDDADFFRALRIFRKKEMLRIGLRDLLGMADLQEIVGELSDLADVCLELAYEWVDAGLRKRYGGPVIQQADGTVTAAGFAVIAMGKLGGRELNFSSDVDLMFVYTADGETEGMPSAGGKTTNRITNHQYFVKLAEKLSAAIGQKTEDGFVFRVDLRLRPEGQRGPLAQSLGGYEIYYESWGQTWERSALIKARPVAGDDIVGREFQNRITPFVYRKYLDYSAIAEIRDMKQKINKDVEQKGKTFRDVKLGYGGVREIEFVIQALQLIYGGRDRSLREKSALKALHRLSQKGLITYEEHESLAKAYVFLRTVEHRIQIVDDLQTHTLPADERELRALARRTGYLEHGREADQLLRDYADHTRKVRSIYDNLFSFTGEEAGPQLPSRDYATLLDPETPEQEAVSLLGRLGFADPGKAFRNLLLIREGEAFVHQTPRSRKLFNELFPQLFEEIIVSPDPDMALNHLESFLAAQGSWDTIQTLARIDTSSLRVLVAIFANSEYLSRMLVSRPQYLQNLLESRRVAGAGTCAKFTKALTDALEHAGDTSEKLDALRRFKHQEEIRIGMADLLSQAQLMTVFHDLSKLAEVCLDAALDLAATETGRRYGGAGSFSGLSVIGVGKLGGRELTYGSDLDILFVFSEHRAAAPPTGMTVFEYFNKVAEKTLAYLSTLTREGFVFRVDTRLRPTGSKGPLVQSIEAFKNYYASQAETWELQAVLQARCVAGDRIVGAEFTSSIHSLIYQKRDHAALARDILSMRQRMEEEVGRESALSYNIKQGAGGIVDIEFLVQYLQLLYGQEHKWVRVPGTYNALRALHKHNLIEDEAYGVLKRAYLFMRQLESRMRIISNLATSELSRDPEKLHVLAHRMGYTDEGRAAGRKLLSDYERHSGQVRETFEKILHKKAG